MISIIIPAYNRGYVIGRTLQSIAKQTYRDFEVIIVDDGSTDNTADVIRNVCNNWKEEVTLIDQKNQGAPSARNKGFKYSRGEYVLFCDADLILKNTCLAKMRLTLDNNPDKSYAYCSFKYGFKTFTSLDFDAEKLKRINYISTTSLIRREHFPGFDESLKKFQDWDLWLTMLEQGHTGVRIKEILFKAILCKDGISAWLPSFAYKIPWKKFGVHIPAIERYEKWKTIVQEKHNIQKF